MNTQLNLPKFSPIGDAAMLLNLSAEISLPVNRRIQALDACLRRKPLEGILEWVPAYTSMLVYYDPAVLDFFQTKSLMEACLNEIGQDAEPQPKQIIIPVCYGDEDGPDLAWLAGHHGISPSNVVKLHSKSIYRVGMMGFTPGFAYLMGLDPNLATPRRESPRTHVPAGSVGIAGSQTGIYPMASPGGWQLIGRTEAMLYDPERDRPFLLSPGDEIQFVPLAEGVMP
jgi:inhibitor of KinA